MTPTMELRVQLIGQLGGVGVEAGRSGERGERVCSGESIVERERNQITYVRLTWLSARILPLSLFLSFLFFFVERLGTET
jgi:hypothetical protein